MSEPFILTYMEAHYEQDDIMSKKPIKPGKVTAIAARDTNRYDEDEVRYSFTEGTRYSGYIDGNGKLYVKHPDRVKYPFCFGMNTLGRFQIEQ